MSDERPVIDPDVPSFYDIRIDNTRNATQIDVDSCLAWIEFDQTASDLVAQERSKVTRAIDGYSWRKLKAPTSWDGKSDTHRPMTQAEFDKLRDKAQRLCELRYDFKKAREALLAELEAAQ